MVLSNNRKKSCRRTAWKASEGDIYAYNWMQSTVKRPERPIRWQLANTVVLLKYRKNSVRFIRLSGLYTVNFNALYTKVDSMIL